MDKLVRPRVLVSCWLARLQKNLSVDNLQKRGQALVNGCLECLDAEETSNHLLVHCSFAMRVWATLLNRFGMS